LLDPSASPLDDDGFVIQNAVKDLAPGSQLSDPSASPLDDDGFVIQNAVKDLAPVRSLQILRLRLWMTVRLSPGTL
jgi:hypothetical protein